MPSTAPPPHFFYGHGLRAHLERLRILHFALNFMCGKLVVVWPHGVYCYLISAGKLWKTSLSHTLKAMSTPLGLVVTWLFPTNSSHLLPNHTHLVCNFLSCEVTPFPFILSNFLLMMVTVITVHTCQFAQPYMLWRTLGSLEKCWLI